MGEFLCVCTWLREGEDFGRFRFFERRCFLEGRVGGRGRLAGGWRIMD